MVRKGFDIDFGANFVNPIQKTITQGDHLGEPPAESRGNNLFDVIDGGSRSTLKVSAVSADGGLTAEGMARVRAEAAGSARLLSRMCDEDGDGELNIIEIVRALMQRPHVLAVVGLASWSTEVRVLEFFKKADVDGSGSVTEAELTEFLVDKYIGKRRATLLGTRDDSGLGVTAQEFMNRQTYGFDQTTFVCGGPGGHRCTPRRRWRRQ